MLEGCIKANTKSMLLPQQISVDGVFSVHKIKYCCIMFLFFFFFGYILYFYTHLSINMNINIKYAMEKKMKMSHCGVQNEHIKKIKIK